MVLSDYDPSSNVLLNPALLADNRTPLQFTVAGGSFLAWNDHGYLPAGSYVLPVALIQGFPMADENTVSGVRNGYGDFSLEGPGAFMVHERSAFGISTRLRMMTDAQDIPNHLSEFVFHDFRHSPRYDIPYDVQNARFSNMVWGELALSFAQMLEVADDHHIQGGVTLKRLFPYSHIGFDFQQMTYEFTSADLEVQDFTGGYAFAPNGLAGRGGWGMDLGVIYRQTVDGSTSYIPFHRKSRCRSVSYRYQVGVSILDFGSASFNERASLVSVENADFFWEDYYETGVESIERLDSLALARVEGDQNPGAQRRQGYNVALPRALNVHGSWNVLYRWQFGMLWQQHLKGSTVYGLRRANLLSLVPRYQTRDFGCALPITYFEYEQLNVGFALRYRYLTLGSDDFLRGATSSDLYSLDLYARVIIPVQSTPDCGPLRGKNARRGGIMPCWGKWGQ